MSTAATPVYEWKTLPWRTLERAVFKLQTRIYRASQRGDTKAVHRLQRLLLHSWSAKCLAVRRVTQDNQGKRTAGVDGVKSLTPVQRLRLTQHLDLAATPRPIRRVWIPKPHAVEQRPLGIPTMHDRAAQALAKFVLEPEWEARFEPNSYGFRPGRSAHDAIEAIFLAIRFKAKYALDADIAKCFDRINHAALLRKMGTFPTLRRAIRAWLTAGVMEGPQLFPTEAGTPQGGVLSPLLANIALHGMEAVLAEHFPASPPALIRYADDFVMLHPEQAVLDMATQVVQSWLAELGLELKPEKTRVTHTLHGDGDRPGFDFLGFTVRQFPVGKHHTGCYKGKPLGFKTIITPSKRACRDHQQQLKGAIRQMRAAPQVALIGQLAPIIRGWSAYYASVVSARIYSKQDRLLFRKLWRWARHRHPNKGRHWVARRYWHHGWRFATGTGPQASTLRAHAATHIQRHVKVRGAKSPFDGDWVYWSQRMQRYPARSQTVTRLLRNQQGKCAFCGLYFTSSAVMEVDHVVPRAQGGTDSYDNRQLLHRHCHDTKSAHDRGRAAEEPYEAKVSRTVLETGGAG